MHAIWIRTFTFVVVLAGAGLLFGQQPQGNVTNQPVDPKTDQGKPSGDKPKEAPPKTKLEEMLQQAMRNNPDIRVAEAKTAEAEAELNRTRLVVMQKVVLYNAKLDDAKMKVEFAQKSVARLQHLRDGNVVSAEEIDAAQAVLQSAKAEQAKIEAELPLLLGTQPNKSATEKGVEWLRRASLDIYGNPNAWRELNIHENDDRPIGQAILAELARGQRFSNEPGTALLIEALYQAGAKPPVQGPMAERIKKALDHEMKVTFQGKPLDVLDSLLQQVEGVPHRIQWPPNEVVGPATLDLTFNQPVSLGAIFQAYQDAVAPSMRMVVRDYGILVTDDKHVPPGAISLNDVWKGGKEKKSEKGEKTSVKFEGKITAVDERTKTLKISIGSDSGLKKNDMLEVYRLDPNDTKYLGQLKVVDVAPTEAVVQQLTAVKDGAVKVGDNVTNQLHDK